MKNRLKTGRYTCRSLWIAGRRDSTVFGVVDDTTTTKFANRACAVHGISLPVVVDKVVVVVLKFAISELKNHDETLDNAGGRKLKMQSVSRSATTLN